MQLVPHRVTVYGVAALLGLGTTRAAAAQAVPGLLSDASAVTEVEAAHRAVHRSKAPQSVRRSGLGPGILGLPRESSAGATRRVGVGTRNLAGAAGARRPVGSGTLGLGPGLVHVDSVALGGTGASRISHAVAGRRNDQVRDVGAVGTDGGQVVAHGMTERSGGKWSEADGSGAGDPTPDRAHSWHSPQGP